jgi:hypothetical protein
MTNVQAPMSKETANSKRQVTVLDTLISFFGPKGHNVPAHGNALGQGHRRSAIKP